MNKTPKNIFGVLFILTLIISGFLVFSNKANAATFVNDTFTDTSGTLLENHTGEVGATWTKSNLFNSQLIIDSANKVRVNNPDSGDEYFSSGTPINADYSVQADITLLSNTAGHLDVGGRASTSVFTCYVFGYTNNAWQLYKFVNLSGTLLGSVSGSFGAIGTTHTIKILMNGSTISGYVDGVLKISKVDSNPIVEKGVAIIEANGIESNTTGQHMDNFTAIDFVPPLTFTGPENGLVNVPSSVFTVTPSSIYTGTITPHSTGTGIFTPASLTWSGDAVPKTFVYTPSDYNNYFPHIISLTSSPTIDSTIINYYAVNNTINSNIYNPVDWGGTPNYEGDSITAGASASDAPHRYVNLVANKSITNINNTALSGSSIRDVIYRRFINSPTINDNQPLSLLIGTNDLLNSSNPYKINKIAEGIRTILANHFLASFTPIDDSSITRTGTWTSLSLYENTFPSKSKLKNLGHSYTSSILGDKLTFSHIGDNLVIGTYGLSSIYNYGRFKVIVDGIEKGTYDPNGKADDWYYSSLGSYTSAHVMPNVFIVSGLGNGTHNVEIVLLDNKAVNFDYVGSMGTSNLKPVIIGHILKSTSAGYALGGGFSSDSDVNSANIAIDQVAQSFVNLGYPVTVAKTEDQFTQNNTADGLHPNNTGMQEVADAWLAVINDITITVSGPSGGDINLTSDNFIVSTATNVLFDGVQTITISDGSNGGMITPSIGSPMENSITVTPPNGTISFTFTYTPVSDGNKTLTITNNKNWINPVGLIYTVDNTPPSTPTATPSVGIFNSTQSVALSATGSDYIKYDLSSLPANCSSGTSYGGPISVATSQTIYVRACDNAGNSFTTSFAYIIDTTVPLTPVATPSSGIFNSTQSVTLSASGSDSIRYSTSATPADCSSDTLYSDSTPIVVSSTQTIYARACDLANNSSTGSFAYTIDTTPPETPTATPSAGSFNSTQSVTLSATGSDYIKYDTSLVTSCSSGISYGGPISIPSSETIYALACDNAGNSSTQSFAYIIDSEAPSTAIASPVAGTYSTTQSVTLTSAGSDSIRYSTTGIPATCSSDTLYINPIQVSTSQTIYVRACDSLNNSSTTSFAYIISPVRHTSSGSSVASRYLNLISTGNLQTAEELRKEFPNQFPNQIISSTLSNPILITKTLKLMAQRMKGEEVKTLQNYLNAKGYNCGVPDGVFGIKTKNAVIKFQLANKLKGDGIVGPKTREMMK